MSDPSRSKQVLDICDQALMSPREEREDFLDNACSGDRELRESVESLLRAVDDSGSFLQVDESDIDDSTS